jgi:D-3-phosphoglycerate dehydrogenase / 2-oxoglutarate reductase
MTSRPFRVLITDRAWPDCSIEQEELARVGAEVVEAPAQDEATLARLAADCDAIGANWARVTERVIRASWRCRIVARFGIGLDNIDVASATELGIPVTNVPDFCVTEVADHALALILAGARNIAFFHQRTKGGQFQLGAGPPLRRLSAAVLGLIGFGNIARNLFPKARALGMTVLAYTRSRDDFGTGCPMVALDDLLARSDFISLHAPLSESTRNMISWPQFARMKRTAWLVNTSRGALIDTAALRYAVGNGRIAGAALDVFDPEPPDLTDPLYRNERVIVTPHAAFVSEESLRDLRTRVARQIGDALEGSRPANVVNPQVYARPK